MHVAVIVVSMLLIDNDVLEFSEDVKQMNLRELDLHPIRMMRLYERSTMKTKRRSTRIVVSEPLGHCGGDVGRHVVLKRWP